MYLFLLRELPPLSLLHRRSRRRRSRVDAHSIRQVPFLLLQLLPNKMMKKTDMMHVLSDVLKYNHPLTIQVVTKKVLLVASCLFWMKNHSNNPSKHATGRITSSCSSISSLFFFNLLFVFVHFISVIVECFLFYPCIINAYY